MNCVSNGELNFWWWVDFVLPGEGWGNWWHGGSMTHCADGTSVVEVAAQIIQWVA